MLTMRYLLLALILTGCTSSVDAKLLKECYEGGYANGYSKGQQQGYEDGKAVAYRDALKMLEEAKKP